MVTIYKYINRINNKVYIGQTSQTLTQRAKKNGEGYKHCLHFYSAIQKYGWENFSCEILEQVPDSKRTPKRNITFSIIILLKMDTILIMADTLKKFVQNRPKKISEAGKGMKNSRAKNVCYNGVPSNLNIRDYAKKYNLNENTLRNWCRKKEKVILIFKGVSTIPDECMGVGAKISIAGSKKKLNLPENRSGRLSKRQKIQSVRMVTFDKYVQNSEWSRH